MAKQRDGLMQTFNADNDPFYIELMGANAFWLIPEQYNFSDVKYLTHLTEEGNPYYEYLPTNEVAWTLPPDAIMSRTARNKTLQYHKMTRGELEDALLEPFPEEESAEQMAELDEFFESPDEKGANEDTVVEEADDATPTQRKSRLSRESPTYTEGDRSSDEDDAEDALASINNKMKNRKSLGSGEDSDGGSSDTLYKSLQSVFEKPTTSAQNKHMSMSISNKTIEKVKETTIKVRM